MSWKIKVQFTVCQYIYNFGTGFDLSLKLNSYIFHINLYDLFLVGTIFIALTFALLLWFNQTTGRSGNRVLAMALTVMLLGMVRVLGIDIRLGSYQPGWDRLPLQYSLAIGPLIYFYVLKITRPGHQFTWKDLLHFNPALLEVGVSQTIPTMNPVIHVLALTSVIIYLYRSQQLIQDAYRRLQPVLMDRPLKQLRWLRRLLKATSVLCFFWLLYAAIGYFGYDHHLAPAAYYPFYIAFTLIMLRIAAMAVLKPPAEVLLQVGAPKPLPLTESRQKGAWLKKAMEAGFFYRDTELSLSALADRLGIHTHELSRIINNGLKKSFNDFVNEYRVRDVAQKMQDPAYDHITLLGIAYEAGFNSQSSFTRIFKQVTGKSPLEYKNNLKKDYPSYKLGSHRQFAPLILNPETPPMWSHEKLNGNYMFRNHLKIAYRNLVKNKAFSALNILGLATGLAACLLIGFYVLDEWSYDRFNAGADRIYRINEDIRFAGNATAYAQAPAPLGAVLKSNFPIVEESVRLKSAGTVIVKKGTQELREDEVAFADPSVFAVFTLPLLGGNPADALLEPNSAVISKTAALKYFGTTDAVGHVLTLNQKDRYKVTGVMQDMPQRSHFHVDFLLSMASLADSRSDVWLSNDYNTYLLLRKGADPKQLDAALPGVMGRYIGPQLQNMAHVSMSDFEKGGNYFRLSLMPLTAIHLESSRTGELGHNGDKQYLYLFFFISLFILAIACINFINLSTAKSAGRAKEVGIRKVLGSARGSLIVQFLSESMLLVFTAMVIAIILVIVCLPFFNDLAGKEMELTRLNWLWLGAASLVITVVVGLAAGTYPALFLSGFRPIAVLKGKLSAGFKSSWLRNSLVVFQFSVAVLLIVATLVVYDQLQYIRHRDLGFDRSRVLVIRNTNDLGHNTAIFKHEIAAIPGVSSAALTGYLPTSEARNSSALFQTQDMDQKKAVQSQTWTVDEDYLPTLGMRLAAGRNFSADYRTDSSAMIINESAARTMGTGSVLNKTLYYPMADGKQLRAYHIIGVVKDFNFSSLKAEITPVVLTLGNDHGALSVRLKGNLTGILDAIKQKWNGLVPGREFDYAFMDQDFDRLYRTEERTGGVFVVLTALAIVIACLGLFGLAAYAAEQRYKEIGIRKVLGANIFSITRMLSVDFIRLVLIAILIAAPLAWYLMQKWLNGFAYRVTLHWWLIALAGTGAILIALLTVSFQSVKAALTNPVKSLRSE